MRNFYVTEPWWRLHWNLQCWNCENFSKKWKHLNVLSWSRLSRWFGRSVAAAVGVVVGQRQIEASMTFKWSPSPLLRKKEKFQASDDYKIILIGRLSTNQSWHLENYCDTYIYFIKLKSREYIVYRKQQYCSFWTVDTLGKWYESEAVLGVGLNPYFVSVLITAAPVSIYYRYFAWNYGVKVFY